MNINQSYSLIDGAINSEGNINHLHNTIRIRGSLRSISTGVTHDVLIQSAFIISAVVSLVLVTCFCWMRWLEYRARNYDLGESQQRPGEDTLNEAEEERLRGKILHILPQKKFLQSVDEEAEAQDGIAIGVGRGCPICLDPFQDEDEICWSHNADCCHVFHTCCIVDWLVKNDLRQCPMCRSFFLIEKDEKCCRIHSSTKVG